MNTTAANVPGRKPRPRRIAADEAHAWARNLRLSNPFAKLVLSMLTLYVDGDGKCFVGIDALAEDTELSVDTVRKRLAWLENVGAIARFPQWVDGNGRRNSEERGRRTTDEIRLLMASDADVIERRALGEVSESSEPAKTAQSRDQSSADPRSQQGQQSENKNDEGSVRGRLGVGLPSDSGKGLDSSNLNQEPEDSPQPPEDRGIETLGGGIASEQWPHTESWAKVETAWGDPILHQQLCRDLWTAFTDVERERFLRVIRGYLAWRLQQRTIPNRCNIQKLMREIDAWAGYEKLAGPDPALRTFYAEHSTEHRALEVIAAIVGVLGPEIKFDDHQGQRGFWRVRPLRPDQVAMEIFFDKPKDQWTTIEHRTPPFYAWTERYFEWFSKRPDNFRVPCLFPPRKDGTFPPPPSQEESTGPPGDEHAA